MRNLSFMLIYVCILIHIHIYNYVIVLQLPNIIGGKLFCVGELCRRKAFSFSCHLTVQVAKALNAYLSKIEYSFSDFLMLSDTSLLISFLSLHK